MPPRKRGVRQMELGPQAAQELLQRIQRDGKLPEDELLQLLHGNEPACDLSGLAPCKSNKKDNPNCMCCLVPNVGSHRKKGLWTKEPAALSTLGRDPNEQRREVRGQRGHRTVQPSAGQVCDAT